MTAYIGIVNFAGRLGVSTAAVPERVPFGPLGTVYQRRPEKRNPQLQPHSTALGTVLLWDGRLDNADELAQALGEWPSSFLNEAQLVASTFDQCGTQAFKDLLGDWSLVAWIERRKTLILAVDYMAMKRLYYRIENGQVQWSNDLEALVHRSKTSLNLDHDYVAGYLAGFPFPGHTPYGEIRSVEPGHFVEITESGFSSHCYWRFNSGLRIRYRTDGEYEEHFRHLFRRSVRRRLRSDSPVLADLSGGLDSSSIVCVADHILVHEGAETPRLDTYSHYDLGEPEGDDLHYIKIVEEKRGRTGHHVDLAAYPRKFRSTFERFQVLPGQFGDSQALETELARIWESGGYKVRLCGIGGDELLGGVPDPRAQLADLLVELRLLRFVRTAIEWSLVKRKPWVQLAWRATALAFPTRFQARVVPEAQVVDWIDADFIRRAQLRTLQLGPSEKYGFRLPSQQECARTIVALARQQASSEHGRAGEELRCPYLDRDLTEFILAIPRDQIIRPGERRSLMRRALRGLVPQEILDRKSKGTAARRPLLTMADEWEELENLVGRRNTSRFGFIDQQRFRAALAQAKAGSAPHLVRLIRTLSLDLWLGDVLQRGIIADPAGFHSVASAVLHHAAEPFNEDLGQLSQQSH